MQIRTLFHAATATAKWRSQLHWQERFKEAVHVRAVLVFDRAATENMYTHAHTNIFFLHSDQFTIFSRFIFNAVAAAAVTLSLTQHTYTHILNVAKSHAHGHNNNETETTTDTVYV